MALERSWILGARFMFQRVGLVFQKRSHFLQSSFSSKPDTVESSDKKKKRKPFAGKVDNDRILLKPTSAESNPDSPLIKSLKKQLKEATQLTNKFQTEVRGSFKPYEVVTSKGASDLTLRRIIGKEEILVKCLLEVDGSDVEGQTESASGSDASGSDDVGEVRIAQRLTMNVQISKNFSKEDQPRVAFLCSYAKGESICIEDIAYFGGSIDKDYPYSGPYFADLDSNLKQTFQTVIKTRGINSSLGDTIMEHLSVQYQDEYLDWLKKLGDFLTR